MSNNDVYYGSAVQKDLKINPSAPPDPNDTDNMDVTTKLNTNIPEYHQHTTNEMGGKREEEDEKICRICLDDDDPDNTMIAPCRCKGSSKWVHRECLDEWRLNEKDRAFSKCTECRFEYYLQPIYDESEQAKYHSRRRCYFYWRVSRDACLGLIVQQSMIALLGIIVWACDTAVPEGQQLPVLLPTLGKDPYILYYLLGWFAFLIIMGIYGLVHMCLNECNIIQAASSIGETPSERAARVNNTTAAESNSYYVPSEHADRTGATTGENSFYNDRSYNSTTTANHDYYRQQRRRRRNAYGYSNRRNRDSYYYYYDPFPWWWYYDCYYCDCRPCCCCCDSGGYHRSGGGGSNDNDCSCCCNSDCLKGRNGNNNSGSGNSGSGDNGPVHIVLMILLVVAIILAIIGFFVGVILAVIAFQRIVSRHIHLLQKRQLVQEFQVMDLQQYDLDQPVVNGESVTTPNDDPTSTYQHMTMQRGGMGVTPTAPPSYSDYDVETATGRQGRKEIDDFNNNHIQQEQLNNDGIVKHPPPSAPVMPADDTAYLKKLGLL